MKLVFFCNLVLFVGTLHAQTLMRSSINTTGSTHSTKIRQTVGQPISSVPSSHFYYGYQSPILLSVSNAQAESIIVYPNPVKTSLHIQSPTNSYSFRLFNSSGKLVKQGILAHKNSQIELVSLAAGFYTLLILNDDEKVAYQMKLIKE